MSARRLNIGIRSGAERSKALREAMRRAAPGDARRRSRGCIFENVEELRRILCWSRFSFSGVLFESGEAPMWHRKYFSQARECARASAEEKLTFDAGPRPGKHSQPHPFPLLPFPPPRYRFNSVRSSARNAFSSTILRSLIGSAERRLPKRRQSFVTKISAAAAAMACRISAASLC